MKPSDEKAQEALRYKEEGNRHFRAADYQAAVGCYTKAIISQPSNPLLWTNRAMAHLKLSSYDAVIEDCNSAITLSPSTMKAHFYLSRALLEHRDFDAALDAAQNAYAVCIGGDDEKDRRSIGMVAALVLECKKARWDDGERRRARQEGELQSEVISGLERDWKNDLADLEKEADESGTSVGQEELRQLEETWRAKIEAMKLVFERARKDEDKMREVPDWAVDGISFAFMTDPVVTKSGQSFDRSSLLDHLRRHQTDPITREPMSEADLRPNYALKQACEDFLSKNGWAADW